MNALGARLFMLLQHLLPRRMLTALVHRLARLRTRPVKDLLIRSFVRMFNIDTKDLNARVPDDFASLNDFFTRELAIDARPIDPAGNSIVSPVDGIVSAAGFLDKNRLLQAKQHYYSLQDLLATDLSDADAFTNGTFATLYLAPWHYHRVHAPWSGRLTAARYVPGDLYSVNDTTVARLPGLFVRNERLVCHFSTESGPMILVFVGALNVGSITTPWSGEIRPRKRGVVEELELRRQAQAADVVKGGLLGWFNMGSTVILLMPPGSCELAPTLVKDSAVVMGRPIATLKSLAP